MHISSYYGLGNIIDALLENEADVNALDNIYRATPLHWTAVCGHIGVIKTLLAVKGININAADQDGATSLHWAVTYNRIDIVNVLLGKKAEVNVVDKHKMTPLHYAIVVNNMDLVSALLKKDADPLLKNRYGYTPRDLTIDEDIKQLLKKTERKRLLKLTIVLNVAVLAMLRGILTTIWYGTQRDIDIIAVVISVVLTIVSIVVGRLAIGVITHRKFCNGVNRPDIGSSTYQPSISQFSIIQLGINTDQPNISQLSTEADQPSITINEMQNREEIGLNSGVFTLYKRIEL